MKTRHLIVGGGLAGATCAFLLKKSGEDVLLVERDDLFTKSKLCGGLLTPRSMAILESIFGPESARLFKQEFSEMTCWVASKRVNISNISMKSVVRKELDDLAIKSYLDLGGNYLDHTAIKEIDPLEKKAVVLRNRSESIEILFDTCIGADGALSTTRELVTGKSPLGPLCLEADVQATGAPLTMYYDSELFGYCWYIPAGEVANVGCCSFNGNDDLDGHLHGFADRLGIDFETRRGAFLPSGGEILLQRNGVYFIGDASGLICPPTGKGIYYALDSAEKLAKALLSSSSYLALMQSCIKEVEKQYETRDLFFNERFINTSLRLADMTPYGAERAIKFALRQFAGFSGT